MLLSLFLHCALAVPTPCTNTKTEVEWCINLAAAQSLEARTRRQADNAEWHSLHGYTVTASNFGRVFNNQKPSTSFLHDLFNPRKIDHLPAIVHGKKFESVAIAQYIKQKSSAGTPVYFRRCGLVLHPLFRYLGASPDGLIVDESMNPAYGLLEVKCPYSAHKDSETITDAFRLKGFAALCKTMLLICREITNIFSSSGPDGYLRCKVVWFCCLDWHVHFY